MVVSDTLFEWEVVVCAPMLISPCTSVLMWDEVAGAWYVPDESSSTLMTIEDDDSLSIVMVDHEEEEEDIVLVAEDTGLMVVSA